MKLERLSFRIQLRFLLDSLLIILAFFLSYYLRKPFSGSPFQPLAPIDQYVWLLVVGLPFWWLTLILFGVYSSTKEDLGDMIWTLGKSSLFMLLMLSFLFFIFNISEINRTFVFLFTVLSPVLMGLWRYVDASFAMNGKSKRLLVVGEGANLSLLIEQILKDPLHRYELVGALSDSVRTLDVAGAKLLGNTVWLYQILHDEAVDEVLFAIPVSELEAKSHLLKMCRVLGVDALLMFEEPWLKDSNLEIGKMFNSPFLYLTTNPINEVDMVAKELLDRTIGLLSLALLAPLMALIAVMVKITSPGPVFFIQARTGRHGRRFPMYKFRTMTIDAALQKEQIRELNEMTGPVFKLKNDPRITRIGKFLRKYSLDELPQLWNVLRGEMSLVGPRPLPCEEAAQIKEAHRRRLSVRPGMTGIWQISGRNEIPYEEWMKLDLQYIDQWSLGLDFKILLKTPVAVLSSKGAH